MNVNFTDESLAHLVQLQLTLGGQPYAQIARSAIHVYHELVKLAAEGHTIIVENAGRKRVKEVKFPGLSRKVADASK